MREALDQALADADRVVRANEVGHLGVDFDFLAVLDPCG